LSLKWTSMGWGGALARAVWRSRRMLAALAAISLYIWFVRTFWTVQGNLNKDGSALDAKLYNLKDKTPVNALHLYK